MLVGLVPQLGQPIGNTMDSNLQGGLGRRPQRYRGYLGGSGVGSCNHGSASGFGRKEGKL